MAWNKRDFSAGSLMYVSSNKLYISAASSSKNQACTAIRQFSVSLPGESIPEWMFSIAIWNP